MIPRRDFLSLATFGLAGAATQASAGVVSTESGVKSGLIWPPPAGFPINYAPLGKDAELQRAADLAEYRKIKEEEEKHAPAALAYGAALSEEHWGTHHTGWDTIHQDTNSKLPRFEYEDSAHIHLTSSRGSIAEVSAHNLFCRMWHHAEMARRPSWYQGPVFSPIDEFRDSPFTVRRLFSRSFSGDEFYYTPRVVVACLFRMVQSLQYQIEEEAKRLDSIPYADRPQPWGPGAPSTTICHRDMPTLEVRRSPGKDQILSAHILVVHEHVPEGLSFKEFEDLMSRVYPH